MQGSTLRHFSVQRNTYIYYFITGALVLFWAYSMRGYTFDDPYITYRHAQNLIRGHGFVFNPNEPVLGTTAPFHGLILAFLSFITPNFPILAFGLSAAALFVVSALIFALLSQNDLAIPGALFTLIIINHKFTYVVFPLETMLLMALLLASFYFAHQKKLFWMGFAGALALGIRSDAIIFLGLLFLKLLFFDNIPIRKLIPSIVPFIFISLPWYLYAWQIYGSPFPNTVSTKTGWTGHELLFVSNLWSRGLSTLFFHPILSGLGLIVCFYGIYHSARNCRLRFLLFFILWILLYTIAYSLLKIFWPSVWYYYPVFLITILFFSIGIFKITHWLSGMIQQILRRKNFLCMKAAFGLTIAPLTMLVMMNAYQLFIYPSTFHSEFYILGRDTAYKKAAQWLNEHPSLCRTVAIYEPGTLAYYSDRHMIDMMGLVTPEAGVEMKKKSLHEVSVDWTVEKFSPDCVAVFNWVEVPPPYRQLTSIRVDEIDATFSMYGRE